MGAADGGDGDGARRPSLTRSCAFLKMVVNVSWGDCHRCVMVVVVW
jgi:hypothetical protein